MPVRPDGPDGHILRNGKGTEEGGGTSASGRLYCHDIEKKARALYLGSFFQKFDITEFLDGQAEVADYAPLRLAMDRF